MTDINPNWDPQKKRTPRRKPKAPFDPCDRGNETNALILDFIGAHRADADTLASQMGVPVEYVLGVSADETGWGTSNAAMNHNNYFGIHANNTPYAGQTGTWTTAGGISMAGFSVTTGYRDSGQVFVDRVSGYVQGVSDPRTFASIVRQHGWGTGTPVDQYVSKVANVIRNIAVRLKCPK